MPALARRAPRRQPAFYGAARSAPQREYHGAARLASLPPAPCPAAGGYRGPASIPLSGASFAGSQREGRDGGVETPQGDAVAEELVRVDARRPAVPWRGHGVCPGAIPVRSRCDPGPSAVGAAAATRYVGAIKGDFDPAQACPGEAHRRRLPITLAGVSGYHGT